MRKQKLQGMKIISWVNLLNVLQQISHKILSVSFEGHLQSFGGEFLAGQDLDLKYPPEIPTELQWLLRMLREWSKTQKVSKGLFRILKIRSNFEGLTVEEWYIDNVNVHGMFFSNFNISMKNKPQQRILKKKEKEN